MSYVPGILLVLVSPLVLLVLVLTILARKRRWFDDI